MTPAAAPRRLRIDAGGDQFPVSEATPTLSWTPGNAATVAHDLEAVIDGQPVPPAVVDATRHRTGWPWPALHSCQRVDWRVREVLPSGPGEWSEWHTFEVGLLDADWTSAWISPVEDHDPGYGRRPAHRLTGEFRVPDGVTSARLYTTALGVYEAFVNGERVGTAELSPGASSYDRTLHAQAADVTSALRAGAGRIELLLSDGWYRGQVGAFRIPAGWGTTLAVRAELHLWLRDGSRRVIVTDERWTSTISTIVRADLMAGQTTDFTATAGVALPVQVGVVDAPPISWSPAPPVRCVENRPPAWVRRLDGNTWIADFGQNASGRVRLSDLGPAGSRTTLDFGEHLDADGNLDTSHLDSQRPGEAPITFVQHDEVISADDGSVFEPRHTVHGFRYARITRDEPLDAGALTMQVVHTDLEATGSFTCSDPDLTRLWDAARWSFRGNAVDIPTDCPTRERLGWTGDYQVFISTATRMYDVLGFSRKWLRSVRDDQLGDGRIANFSPDGRRIKHHLDDQLAMMTGSAGWGDAIIEVPWQLYRAYGDPQVLAENWDAMVAWTDWALGVAASQRHPSRIERSAEPLPHEQYLWDGSFHWGEWAEPKPKAADGTPIDPMQTNPMAWFMADKGEVGTAYLHRSTATLARIATILGRTEDADRYREIADHVVDAWRTEYLHPDGRTNADTQAGYVRALTFGLIPDDLREAAANRLVQIVHDAGNHLTTGFLSTADLLPVLADTGHPDVAYNLLFQRTPPSWLAMLDRGATTIWEDWDGIDDNGRAHDSLNHYSKGAVVRFLHSHILGIRQDDESTAWESFTVAPVPHATLTSAHGSLETPQGTITVDWQTTGEGLRISVDVPAGANARIVFPDGHSVSAGPGRHDHTHTGADS